MKSTIKKGIYLIVKEKKKQKEKTDTEIENKSRYDYILLDYKIKTGF